MAKEIPQKSITTTPIIMRSDMHDCFYTYMNDCLWFSEANPHGYTYHSALSFCCAETHRHERLGYFN